MIADKIFQIITLSQLDINLLISKKYNEPAIKKTLLIPLVVASSSSCYAVDSDFYTFIITPINSNNYNTLSHYVWIIILLGSIAIYSDFLTSLNKNIVNTTNKTASTALTHLTNPLIIFLATLSISHILLGSFSLLTYMSWGLFELSYITSSTQYIYQSLMIITGVIGTLLYLLAVHSYKLLPSLR